MPLTGEYAPSSSDWPRQQVEMYEKSDGAEGGTMFDAPVVILTSVGAKTGKLRKAPLIRVEHDGEYAAVASAGGGPKNPDWYNNLVANPHVEIQDGAVKRDYVAREVTDDERALWWKRAAGVYPGFDDYVEKTSREIPVFVLTPA